MTHFPSFISPFLSQGWYEQKPVRQKGKETQGDPFGLGEQTIKVKLLPIKLGYVVQPIKLGYVVQFAIHLICMNMCVFCVLELIGFLSISVPLTILLLCPIFFPYLEGISHIFFSISI